jgi:hypothetical protein
MPKRPKRPRDPAQLAKLVVDIAAGQVSDDKVAQVTEKSRAGGLTGGLARAKALTEGRRSEIARTAAKTRWQKTTK